MAITKPPVLPAWADAGDKVQPSNAELSVGWPVSSTPPSRQRFNWIFNYVANAVRYFSRRGMPDYDSVETYMIGDRVIGDDGKTYKCLVDNTTGLAPSTNPAKWARWGFTVAELKAEGTGLQAKGFTIYTALSSIPASACGSVVQAGNGAGAYTLTLPACNSTTSGDRLEFVCTSTFPVTISPNGSDTIGLTPVVLNQNDTIELQSNGTNTWFVVGGTFLANWTRPGFSAKGQQRFTSNGSFTVPVGVTQIWVSGAAGGGGGGGSGAVSGITSGWGAGGGGGGGASGAYTNRQAYLVTPGQVLTVVIGGAGTAGTAGTAGGPGGVGGTGGTTSINGTGVSLSMAGGPGGGGGGGVSAVNNAAGSGGASGGAGATNGFTGVAVTGYGYDFGGFGGSGGGNPFGTGGGGQGSNSTGQGAWGYGSGGGGAGGPLSSSSASGFAGGSGSQGFLDIVW